MVVKKSRSITSKTVRGDEKNVYKSPRSNSDRNSASLEFPVFEIGIREVSSVLLLLQAEEMEVVQKALHYFDKFASHGIQHLYKLFDQSLLSKLLPLCKSDDTIVKRFSFKLLVQFAASIPSCRKLVLEHDELFDESRSIFTTSPDDVLVEFSSILLRHICDDPKRVDSLGRDEIFLKSVFEKFKSHDADILLNSIRLLNIILKNSMLIEAIMVHRDFPLKNIQIELGNEIEEIRGAALESLLLITNFRENPFWEVLSSERMVEAVFGVCMQDDPTPHQAFALKIFLNLTSHPSLLLHLSQSTHLPRLLTKFSNKSAINRGILLDVLMAFTKIDDNRRILCENGIIKDVLEMLKATGSSEACEAISVLSSNIFCLTELLCDDIYMILLNVAMEGGREWDHRIRALSALHKVIVVQGVGRLVENGADMGEKLAKALRDCENLSFLLGVVGVIEKLGRYLEVKARIAGGSLGKAVFSAIKSECKRSTRLTVALFNVATEFMDQESFQGAFLDSGVADLISSNLKTPSSQLKSAVCNLIGSASMYKPLFEVILNSDVLTYLGNHFECLICSDIFNSILDQNLAMKFHHRRKLTAAEKIPSGFFATKPATWISPQSLHNLMSNDLESPRRPVYTINFDDSFSLGTRSIRNDRNLIELLNEIKSDGKFIDAEIHDKIKIVARRVAKFQQTSEDCIEHDFHLHLNELKFRLSTSVIPIGCLIYGNSFEAALLFKTLVDRLDLNASLHTNDTGKAWNLVCDETNIVDLAFDVGELYEATSYEARKYLQKIS